MTTKNFDLLEEHEPNLAQVLSELSPETFKLSFSRTRAGELNLLDESFSPPVSLHAQYSIESEMLRWLAPLKEKNFNVLYLYGVGLGYSYDFLKNWLHEKQERYIIYLENDPRVFYRLMELDRGREIVKDPQVFLINLEGEKELRNHVLEYLCHYFIGSPYHITALPSYSMHKTTVFEQIQAHIHHTCAHIHFAGLEFMSYGASFYRNFYKNMFLMTDSPNCNTNLLFNQFKNVPAIICGAGPSLNKNFKLLKTLQDHALIFAGGSAITALTNHGLIPHFGGTVDPNSSQYDRLKEQSGYELPMFFKSRVFSAALKEVHGPHIYLPGNASYPITDWFESELGIEGKMLSEGKNILHLLINIAVNMGCNPIIFTGMDLAYTGMQLYADGVIENSKASKEELTKGSHINFNAFTRKDIHGNDVYTLWKWVGESNYTADFAKKHPDNTFVNATEGGLGFEGIANQPLEEVKNTYLKKQHDLKGLVHTKLQLAMLPNIPKHKIIEYYQTISQSLYQCEDSCLKLIELFKKLENAVQKDKSNKIGKISDEIDQELLKLDEEIAYQKILAPANQVRSVLFERSHNEINRKQKTLSDKSQMLKRCEMHLNELNSLREGRRINHFLMQRATKELKEEGFLTSEQILSISKRS